MNSPTVLDRETPPARHAAEPTGRGSVLTVVFDVLDRAGIPYCLPHGCGDRAGSDVDCVIPADVRPERVAAVLHENRAAIGAEVVRCLSGHVVLATTVPDGAPGIVDLDLSSDYELKGRRFYSGSEILAGRRRQGSFWLPAAAIEFGCSLVRRVGKGRLDDDHARRLSELYRKDTAGAGEQITRFWTLESASVIAAAAESGDWDAVRRDLAGLRAELLRRATLRSPLRLLGHGLSRLARVVKRYARPEGGVGVILLGPDGAGKSSVIAAVRGDLAGVFPTSTCLSFPPAVLRRLLGRPEGPVTLPHAQSPRSPLASIVRAVGYWFVYYTVGYWLDVRPALARSSLVLHDRHMVDALVDPTRYRYAGPRWLLRLIWRLIPKPDLIVLLDAPAAVLQARKQEVAFEVTARQRDAYRALLGVLGGGQVVDVARPIVQVASEVDAIVLQVLGERVRRRLDVGGRQ
jgi:thymidylate kinase